MYGPGHYFLLVSFFIALLSRFSSRALQDLQRWNEFRKISRCFVERFCGNRSSLTRRAVPRGNRLTVSTRVVIGTKSISRWRLPTSGCSGSLLFAKPINSNSPDNLERHKNTPLAYRRKRTDRFCPDPTIVKYTIHRGIKFPEMLYFSSTARTNVLSGFRDFETSVRSARENIQRPYHWIGISTYVSFKIHFDRRERYRPDRIRRKIYNIVHGCKGSERSRKQSEGNEIPACRYRKRRNDRDWCSTATFVHTWGNVLSIERETKRDRDVCVLADLPEYSDHR